MVRPGTKLQPYWARLSRVALAAAERPATTDEVRRFQRDELAVETGRTALVELLPLPSPATTQWIYGEHSKAKWLASRADYRAAMLRERTELLCQLIATHQPDAVVFFGATERAEWNQIAGVSVPSAPEGPVRLPSGSTAIVVQHPSAFGVTNDYYASVGAALAEAGATPDER